MTQDQPDASERRMSMGARIRAAGDNAIPMLTALHIKAAAHAFMAVEALERSEDEGGPDPVEARERLTRVIRILVLGEA